MSRMFSVIAPDGQAYGPADEATLAAWAGEGRITPQSTLQCAQTGQRIAAAHLPSLSVALGLSPQMVNQLLQPQAYPMAQAVQPAHQPYSYATAVAGMPQPVGYAHPPVYGIQAPAHQLTEFSAPLVVLLHFVTGGLFSLIHFGLMHDKLPRIRPDDPTGGKAIGFLFIPFFNLYWTWFHHLRLVDRINEQRMRVGLAPGGQKGLFIAGMCCIIASFPLIFVFIGFLTLPAGAILLLTFMGSLQGSVNELVRYSRGAAF